METLISHLTLIHSQNGHYEHPNRYNNKPESSNCVHPTTSVSPLLRKWDFVIRAITQHGTCLVGKWKIRQSSKHLNIVLHSEVKRKLGHCVGFSHEDIFCTFN